ncbi:(2Fe-2S)-binding protein [Streptomyces sp. NPDC088789]|uniref:(2Fe-2S)-binding protein n=1 Tax=Streptomyces sp. NPDC088789 TaxID=3365899 RepID=UPI0037F9FE69
MPLPSSSVADSFARLAEVYPWLSIRELTEGEAIPEGDGWVSAGALSEGGAALDTFLAWDDTQIRRDYGEPGRPDVVASFGLHRYAWTACLLITVPWFVHRRVPRFPVAQVAYHRDESRMAVRTGSFACLPGDPAAALPGARVVADEAALRDEVRAAVAEHLEPVLGAFGPRMRRRGRALWGMATDEIVEGLWYIAGLLGEGEKERAERELDLLMPGTVKPYAGSAAFRVLTGPAGEALPTRDRVTCCMYYTLRPDDVCATCPRSCDAERVVKLMAEATA